MTFQAWLAHHFTLIGLWLVLLWETFIWLLLRLANWGVRRLRQLITRGHIIVDLNRVSWSLLAAQHASWGWRLLHAAAFNAVILTMQFDGTWAAWAKSIGRAGQV